MQLNPYGEDVVNLAADLANRRPADPAELTDRCRAAGLTVDDATPADLDRTLSALDDWERAVDADGEEERAALVNQMLTATAAYPRLTNHTGGGWHVHYRDEHQPVGAILHTLIAVGTAFHLAGRGMHRLRRCAVAECSTIFADTSRTGRQRYCSQRCANRDAVRRHRSRASAA
ncbi:CGNR zinc finger domain-containing protein [Streptomyces boninensis]|uniref:CGNR zinc finger domain-containing protein n=1 Tax=Streptomyces boninensis TaxID=2039455 RepID=UPI003B21F2BF